jgi:murein DD-endopeptidase MepM/ murein hydrolase activator NlpD
MKLQVGLSDSIAAPLPSQPASIGGATRTAGKWLLVGSFLLLQACAIPRWPAGGPLTSGYGLRFRGLTPSIHHGVDVSVPEGTPVRAMKAGRVTHAGSLGSYGIAVIVDHGGGWTSLYAHLSRSDVSTGEQVSGQAVLGLSGQTGNATGPHLHFEIRRYGWTADPIPLLGGPPPDAR